MRATRDGELFLFVNDAPDTWSGGRFLFQQRRQGGCNGDSSIVDFAIRRLWNFVAVVSASLVHRYGTFKPTGYRAVQSTSDAEDQLFEIPSRARGWPVGLGDAHASDGGGPRRGRPIADESQSRQEHPQPDFPSTLAVASTTQQASTSVGTGPP